jgi:hypothetical protein
VDIYDFLKQHHEEIVRAEIRLHSEAEDAVLYAEFASRDALRISPSKHAATWTQRSQKSSRNASRKRRRIFHRGFGVNTP